MARGRLAGRRRAGLQYGLAQVLDGRGQYDRAAELAREANDYLREEARQRGRGYDPAEHHAHVEKIIQSYSSAHFEREQAIFSYQMGTRERSTRTRPLSTRLLALRSVPAPVVVRGWLGRRRLVFRTYSLPRGFDVRDHPARVREFERAFVLSVVADPEDYRAARRYVTDRFGRRRR